MCGIVLKNTYKSHNLEEFKSKYIF